MSMTHQSSAPVDVVWATATDIQGCAAWLSGVDSIEILEGGDSFGVGTSWNETRSVMGKQGTEKMVVTAAAGPHSYTVEADSGGIHYVSLYEFTPTSDGTSIRFTFSGEGGGLMTKIMGPLGNRIVSKQLRRDLADLAKAAEAAAAGR